MFEKNGISDHFKRKARRRTGNHPAQVYFQINFDDWGAYLSVIDKNGAELSPDYVNYSGATRSVLRSLEQLLDRNDFVIDWEKPKIRIYLGEHEYLLWQLQACDNVFDSRQNPLSFAPGQGKMIVELEKGEAGRLHSRLKLEHGGQLLDEVQVISENHILSEQKIYEIAPLGEAYQQLALFETELAEIELEQFLSLLFSYAEHIELRYQDFDVQKRTEPVEVKPCLVFEKVDADNSLQIRVAQELPNISFDFLEQFDVYKIAEVNEMERVISVRPIQQNGGLEDASKVFRLLKKHAPTTRERGEIIREENRFIIPEKTAALFVYNELPELLNYFTVYGAEKLKTYRVRAVQPRLDLSLNSGINYFEGEAVLDFEGERIALFDAIRQFKKHKYLKLSDGTHAIVNPDYLQKLERIFKKEKKGVKLSFFDLPIAESLLSEKLDHAVFDQAREVFEGFNHIRSQKTRLPEINAELRTYQKDGYKWLRYLNKHGLGGCLADDMGLGKTLQTITLLSSIYPEERLPSLIVMPRSLLYNWQNEVAKFSPQLKTHLYYGQGRNWKSASKAQLILTTYGTVRNDIESLKDQAFSYVVLDESQHIKNYQSQTSQSVTLLNSKHRLALSGTPIENNLGELYSLFRFLNPAMFRSVRDFNEHYATPIQKNHDKRVITELRAKIYPFVLRRLKQEVLTELPDKMEQILYVEMSPEQKVIYEERRMYYQQAIQQEIATSGFQKARFAIIQGLSELRQLATVPESKTEGAVISPKLEVLEERLVEAFANGHKVLIFVNYLAGIESISEVLERIGVNFVSMTGGTRNRQELVDQFQNDRKCKAFLMTLKTGGLGLNLTAADTIFIYDPWWNIAAETQAVDRAHRIGQTQKVISYKLITQGTIEEKILILQEKKKELFDDIISSDGAALKSLSESDIDFILG